RPRGPGGAARELAPPAPRHRPGSSPPRPATAPAPHLSPPARRPPAESTPPPGKVDEVARGSSPNIYDKTPSASALDREFRPTGQRGRPVVQEYDPARFRERQIRSQRAVVDGELLQDLPVVLIGGVQPGAF